MKQRRWLRKSLLFTFANGVSGAGLIQEKFLAVDAEVLNILQINGLNTNSVTAQVKVYDEDDNLLFDGTAKAHNASHNHEFGVTIRRLFVNKTKVEVTISGDPGVSGYVVEVISHLVGHDN